MKMQKNDEQNIEQHKGSRGNGAGMRHVTEKDHTPSPPPNPQRSQQCKGMSQVPEDSQLNLEAKIVYRKGPRNI